jgi:hypothetical protein
MWVTFRVTSSRLYLSASRLGCEGDGMGECKEVRGERWKREESQGGAVKNETRASECVRVYVDA